MRNIDAKSIILLHRHLNILPDQRISLRNIDNLLKKGLILTVHPDEDRILHINIGLIMLDIVDEPFSEVGELWLEDKQTTLFVIPPSADSLAHEDTVSCAI
jgi:hypothetical protein